jgi:uncharacterized protein YqgC (DUF456 family)
VEYFWLVVTILILLIGILGTIVPMLPGIPLMYGGYLVWGLASGWKDFGATTMVILGIITFISILLDYYSGAIGAKKYGASTAGVIGALLGGIVGVILLNVPGLILGPFLGAVIGEMFAGKNQKEAWRAGWGAFLGFLAGSLFKVTSAIMMFFLFLYFLIF